MNRSRLWRAVSRCHTLLQASCRIFLYLQSVRGLHNDCQPMRKKKNKAPSATTRNKTKKPNIWQHRESNKRRIQSLSISPRDRGGLRLSNAVFHSLSVLAQVDGEAAVAGDSSSFPPPSRWLASCGSEGDSIPSFVDWIFRNCCSRTHCQLSRR